MIFIVDLKILCYYEIYLFDNVGNFVEIFGAKINLI